MWLCNQGGFMVFELGLYGIFYILIVDNVGGYLM